LAYIPEVSSSESATPFFEEKIDKNLSILLILTVSTMCMVKNAPKWTSWQVSSDYPSENQQLWNIQPEYIKICEGVKQNFQIPPGASGNCSKAFQTLQMGTGNTAAGYL